MFVAGTWLHLPDSSVTVAEAIRGNRYSPAEAEGTEQIAAAVATNGDAGPDFALHAAREALKQSGHHPDDIAVLLYAYAGDPGIRIANIGCFLQHGLGAQYALPAQLSSGCDAALVALDLACSRLQVPGDNGQGATPQPAALIAAADYWPDQLWDRWRTVHGLVYGDGGSALVVSRDRGFARLVALAHTTAAELEGLHRGAQRFGPDTPSAPNMKERADHYFDRVMPKKAMRRLFASRLREAVDQALEEAAISLSQVAHVVYAFVGAQLLEHELLEPLGIDRSLTTFDLTQGIGDLGAAGPFAGYHLLRTSGRLRPGDHALLVGVGGGFVFSAAVLETLEEPTQADLKPAES